MILNHKRLAAIDILSMLRLNAYHLLFLILLSSISSTSAQTKATQTKAKSSGWSVNTKEKLLPVEENIEASAATEKEDSALEDSELIVLDTPLEQTHTPVEPVAVADVSTDEVESVAIGDSSFIKDDAENNEPTFEEPESKPASADNLAAQSLSAINGTHDTANSLANGIALKQTVDRNLEYKDTLEQQYAAIQQLAETEDAFNEQFGELYLAYARSLLRVGRLEEARKMFANALHNAKINNGVNSLEQRPILRELFSMNLSIGNSAEAEKHLKRLIWLDSSFPVDTYSFDMIMQLANYYLDQYLMAPKIGEDGLTALNKAIRYFGYTIRRYHDAPEAKNLTLPYGDVAYAHFLKTQIRPSVDDDIYLNARKRGYLRLDKHDSPTSIDHSFSQSNRYLRLAFDKASKEKDVDATIKAIVNIGDLHLLYGNHLNANVFYQRARKVAENLPEEHPILRSFNEPVELPAFDLSVERGALSYGHSYQVVPMLLDINRNGYIGGVTRQPDVNIPMGMRIRAKNAAKSLRFRPIINKETLVSVDDLAYDVKVRIRNFGSVANKESEE